jgi:hypothetical protein
MSVVRNPLVNIFRPVELMRKLLWKLLGQGTPRHPLVPPPPSPLGCSLDCITILTTSSLAPCTNKSTSLLLCTCALYCTLSSTVHLNPTVQWQMTCQPAGTLLCSENHVQLPQRDYKQGGSVLSTCRDALLIHKHRQRQQDSRRTRPAAAGLINTMTHVKTC